MSGDTVKVTLSSASVGRYPMLLDLAFSFQIGSRL